MAASLLIIAGSAALRYHENAAVKAKYAGQDARETAAFARQGGDEGAMPQNRIFTKPAPAAQAGEDLPDADNIFGERLAAYADHPSMVSFNKEIAAVIGEINSDDFITGDFHEKFFNNPQIQKILLKYSKDPAFMKVVDQIMSDNAR